MRIIRLFTLAIVSVFLLSLIIPQASAESINDRLFDAVMDGNIEMVEKWLNQGANVNARYDNPQDEYYDDQRAGFTPLHMAIYLHSKNYIKIIQCLLKWGADINAKSLHQETPLQLATDLGLVTVEKLLLNNTNTPTKVDIKSAIYKK